LPAEGRSSDAFLIRAAHGVQDHGLAGVRGRHAPLVRNDPPICHLPGQRGSWRHHRPDDAAAFRYPAQGRRPGIAGQAICTAFDLQRPVETRKDRLRRARRYWHQVNPKGLVQQPQSKALPGARRPRRSGPVTRAGQPGRRPAVAPTRHRPPRSKAPHDPRRPKPPHR
jgi:hypothetical protein